MQNNRASIFAPFAALSGLGDALRMVEKINEEKKELSIDTFEYLNEEMKNVKIGSNIKVCFYNTDEYIETIGKVKKIDNVYKKIYLDNSIINMNDIVSIKVLVNNEIV